MFKLNKSTEPAVVPSVKQNELTQLQKNQSTIKDIIAPGGVDASYTNHIGIISSKTRLGFASSSCFWFNPTNSLSNLAFVL